MKTKGIVIATSLVLFFLFSSIGVQAQIEVWTAEDLDDVRDNLSAAYVQMADIDLADYDNWDPIGKSGAEFTGTYDGNGFTISNLTVNRPAEDDASLFGRLNYAEIKNVTLINADVTGNATTASLAGYCRYNVMISNCHAIGVTVTGSGSRVGGLVGEIRDSSSIVNSSAIDIDVTGVNLIGGLVGWNIVDCSVIDSHASGVLTATAWGVGGLVGCTWNAVVENSSAHVDITAKEWAATGGLVGRLTGAGTVKNSFATGIVDALNAAGGLVGSAREMVTIENSYATGNVIGYGRVGGLVGEGDWFSNIYNSYSTGEVEGDSLVGGFIGHTYGDVHDSYWDIETSGIDTSYAGEGRTTEQMTYPYDPDTYVGWDFDDIWEEDTDYSMNDGYPYLQWQFVLAYPDPVDLAYPADGQIIEVPDDEVEVKLGWHTSQPEVTNYRLDIAEDAGFTEMVFTDDGITDTFYVFTDIEDQKEYYWRVCAENATGWGDYSEVWSFTTLLVGVPEREIPTVYSLMQNYPNPFNPSTVIRYGLPERSNVRIEVYNTLGQRVDTLIDAELEAGYHQNEWYSGKAASGMYFYRIEAVSTDNPSNHFMEVKSMILLK